MDIITSRNLLRALGGTGRRTKTLARLRLTPGVYVTNRELVDYVYGDLEAGGPLWARYCIRVYIHKLRAKGHTISNDRHLGYRLDLVSTRENRRSGDGVISS